MCDKTALPAFLPHVVSDSAIRYPEVFTGLLEPWRGVLLHGPPGSGKTLLARAVAAEGCTFFNITCSSIINKWRGESEKIVKVVMRLCCIILGIVLREIDPAILRRLEKRIFIPLPDFKTRTELFQMYLSSDNIELVPKVSFEELAAKTEGYSGSDIKLVCKEALMAGVRKMMPHMNKSFNSRKDKITLSDILTAIEKTKPVSKSLEKKHEDWQNEMGSA
ncbi:katanin p60 ATPase-containing subunit A 2 [Danaus plexippus plexippus]|uniref:Katanin p60 ATPase-containing subunit A 2 n=1 Tax=Danaus plexippus plexippus TaxID=278856 RepID=A0A212FI94_DANPL|nr:katanin p60 ATPase-containing subunit A 2 [Danaus plexippus plexippus]